MPRVKLFNEEDILYKAMELFWEKGYHATSIQDMVKHLGINRGSLYDTFNGKKNLFNESLSLYCKINQEGTAEFINKQKNVKDGIRNIFEAFIGGKENPIDRRGCFVVKSINEFSDKDEDLNKVFLGNKDFYENLFYEFLLKGQKTGEISKDKDIKTISFLIFTLFNGIKVVSKLEQNNERLLASIDNIMTLLD